MTNEFYHAIPALTSLQKSDLIASLTEWQQAGCHVHSATNGKKKPLCFWEANGAGDDWGYERIRDGIWPPMSLEEMTSRINRGQNHGIGIFCGRPSNALEMVEVEARAMPRLNEILAASDAAGCRHLMDRLTSGCVEESGGGGRHFLLRVSDEPAAGNEKLALCSEGEVLCETRGQGGWFVAAPSGGRTHQSGRPYRMLAGSPATIPFFTGDEKRQLFDCFRVITERPVSTSRRSVRRRKLSTVEKAFQPLMTWEEILIPLGWTKYGRPKSNVQEWSRPGRGGSKSAAVTATTFCCWSSSTPLPAFEQPVTAGGHGNNVLSKLDVFAILHHNGDYEAALQSVGLSLPIETLPARKPEDERGLKSWREEAAVEKAIAIYRPGLHGDFSPTGSGKTYGTIQALKRLSSSVTALRTHINCEERVLEMKQQGLEATAFPKLSEKTCQAFGDTASTAMAYGLSVGAAVCPGCPFNKDKTCSAPDQYQGLLKAAKAAKHKVCTHERLRLSSLTITEEASAVVIDETPEEVLAPTLIASMEDLAVVRDFIGEVIAGVYASHELAFATRLQQTYKSIFERVKILDQPGVFNVPLESVEEAETDRMFCEWVQQEHGTEVPPLPVTEASQWQRMFFQWVRKFGVKNASPERQKAFQRAIGLLARATTGDLRVCQLLVERKSRHELLPDGTVSETTELHHLLRGSWLLKLDYENTPVFTLDATGSRTDLEAATGRHVEDITPSGFLPFVKPATQVVLDLTKGQEPGTLAALVMDFLDEHPEIQRLGIVGHQKQVKGIMADREILPEAYFKRISKSAHWGEGPERASNLWHRDCDHLMIAGTPRRNATTIRSWLELHGLSESAQLPSGDWGPRRWSGVDESLIVDSKGHRHPDWHRASIAMTRADLQQALGRARAILEDGIPVTVFSDEPTGLPLSDPPPSIPVEVRATLEALKRTAKRPIITNIDHFAVQISAQTAVETISEVFGIDRRAAEYRLANVVNAGKLSRLRRGLYELPIVVKPPLLPATIVEVRPAPVTSVFSTIDIDFDSLDRQIDPLFDAFDRQIDDMRSMLASLLRPPDAVPIEPELLCWAGVGGMDLRHFVLSRPHVTAVHANPLESEKGHAWPTVAPVTGEQFLGQ